MLPLVYASICLLSGVSFIGYQIDDGSHSRQQSWHTSVNMVQLSDACSRTVSERQRALAVVTCVLHRRDSWSFLERGRNMATEAFRPMTSYLEHVELRAPEFFTVCIQKQIEDLSE